MKSEDKNDQVPLKAKIEELEGIIKELKEESRRFIEDSYEANENAFYDKLTGLARKALFLEIISDYFVRPIRLGQERERRDIDHEYPKASIILFCIDDFENLIEIHGYSVGSEILKAVAKVILAQVREYDFASRWSTEKFAVILEDALCSEAISKADAIREKISQFEFAGRDGSKFSITVSAGVAYSDDFDNIDDVMVAVNASLSQSRKNGSNKVTAYSEN